MSDRFCEACGGVLVRRTEERTHQWAKRRFCSQSCVAQSRAAKSLAPVAMEQPHGQSLTVRELQVVQCVARGMTNVEIGAALGLAPTTVKQHLVRIGAKFSIGDRAGIVGAAFRRSYLQVPVTNQVPPGFDRDLFDVLVRIARGMSNSEIAADLRLSFEGTKYRVRRLLAVLGACSREEAVAVGVACGALPLVRVRRLEQVAARSARPVGGVPPAGGGGSRRCAPWLAGSLRWRRRRRVGCWGTCRMPSGGCGSGPDRCRIVSALKPVRDLEAPRGP